MPDIIIAPYVNSTLGFDVTIQIPANLNELSKAFPAEDVHSAAVRQSLYNGWNNKFRPALAKFVEDKLVATHGDTAKRKQKVLADGSLATQTKRDGTSVPILEQEKNYLAWIVESGLTTKVELDAWANEVALTIPFKVAKAEEEALPAKEYFAFARNLLAKAEAGSVGDSGNPITEEGFIANFVAQNPVHDPEALGGWSEVGIARMVEINHKRLLSAGGGLC